MPPRDRSSSVMSDESGRFEIYVAPFPRATEKVQVSAPVLIVDLAELSISESRQVRDPWHSPNPDPPAATPKPGVGIRGQRQRVSEIRRSDPPAPH